MKKIVSLLVVVSMMLTMCVSGFAAMTANEMYEALTGVHASNPYGAESGLIDAYKNVSPAQMAAMKVLVDKLAATDYTDASNAIWTGVLSETEDALKTQEIGFILDITKLIAYAQDPLDVNSYFKGNPANVNSTELKTLLVNKLTAESAAFQNGAYQTLNTYANDKLTKDAFGGLIIDLKDKFVKVIKTNKDTLTAAFTSNDQDAYTTLVENYFIQALCEVIGSPAYPEFAVNAIPAMAANGFVDTTTPANSKFVKWVQDAFKFLKAVDSDAVCVIANTVIAAISDIDIVLTSGLRINPNKVVSLASNGSATFNIKTAEEVFTGTDKAYGLNLDLTNWFDLKLINYDGTAFTDATITYDNVAGTFTITGANADRTNKYGVLQLYRNATTDQGNDDATHQLFAEFQVQVGKVSSGNGGGGGGGAASKFEITFMVDGKVHDHVNVVNGKLAEVPKAPEKDGYNFIGWSTDGETTVDPATVELSKNTVFYALFKEIPAMDKDNHFAYVIGYEDGEFKPERNITRAEAATIFSRLLIKKIDVNETYTTEFTDVADDAWYHDYVAYMEELGVVTGYPDGTFRPDDSITRAEFATMASRFDKLSPAEISFFEDVPAEHWAYDYVESAATKGWIKGYEDGTFRPENNITREETVTIVNRMLERAADKDYVEANGETIIDYSDIDNTRWSYYEIIEASNSHLYGKTEGVETWTSVDNSANYH